METKTKILDQKDIESLTKAIEKSKEDIRRFSWEVKTKQAMLDEGLDVNYISTKRRLIEEIAQNQANLDFETKVIAQYQEVLAKGEMQVPVEVEKEG